MKLLPIFLVFALLATACGPAITKEDEVDGSSDATAFRENAEGTWSSQCNTFTDGSGKPVSVTRELTFNDRSAQIRELTFSNYSCAKPAKHSSSYNTATKVIEANSDNDVVVEFTNKSPKEGHFVTERTHFVIANNSLKATVVGRSLLRDGNEEWLDEGEFNNDRSFAFKRTYE